MATALVLRCHLAHDHLQHCDNAGGHVLAPSFGDFFLDLPKQEQAFAMHENARPC